MSTFAGNSICSPRDSLSGEPKPGLSTIRIATPRRAASRRASWSAAPMLAPNSPSSWATVKPRSSSRAGLGFRFQYIAVTSMVFRAAPVRRVRTSPVVWTRRPPVRSSRPCGIDSTRYARAGGASAVWVSFTFGLSAGRGQQVKSMHTGPWHRGAVAPESMVRLDRRRFKPLVWSDRWSSPRVHRLARGRRPVRIRGAMHVPLASGAWLDHDPAWLAAAEADAALVALRDELAWEQRAIVLFGRRVLQPRLVAWAGDLGYRYSGQTLEPRPATRSLVPLLERVVARAGVAFNHVLANRYRDGRDSMGMHADDEPELGEDPVVATLSLGATRRFVIARRRGAAGDRHSLPLAGGSLLVMGGACQSEFRHGLPRDPAAAGERISLTLRTIAE